MKSVSIVIPVYIGKKEIYDMTVKCLLSMIDTVGDAEVIVVDDGSPEQRYIDMFGKIKKFSNIKIIKNKENMGFAKAVNRGIKEAKNDLILLLNNDVFIKDRSWIKDMVECTKKYDIVAPAFGKIDRTTWHYLPGEERDNSKIKDKKIFKYAAFWCTMIRRSVFDQIGLIPEDFGRGFFEDSLFGYRAEKAGISMGIVNGLYEKVEHLYHTTFKSENINLKEQYLKNREIFIKIKDRENEEKNNY